MQTKKDYSYGVIPVFTHSDGTIKVLVIYQYSAVKGQPYWTFPKGHAEGDESAAQSALRELREETGVIAELFDDTSFCIQYDFTVDGTIIKKEVQFFLGVVTDQQLQLQATEVADAKWCAIDEARALLTYSDYKHILDQASAHQYFLYSKT